MALFSKLSLPLVLLLVLSAPAAANFPDNSALLFSSEGDWVGGGLPHLYTDEDATISVSGSASSLTLHAVGNDLHSFNLTFGARQGGVLKPGSYKDPVRSSTQGPNKPVMDISGDGHGCNMVTGSFEVKDIASDAAGAITRLQVLYEQHCEGATAALFGEVRFGEPTAAPAAVTPSELRFPAIALGQTAAPAGVSLLVTEPLSVASVAITGPDAGDFSRSVVTCTGTCPNPAGPFGYGDITGVGVRYAPAKAEKSSATLRIV